MPKCRNNRRARLRRRKREDRRLERKVQETWDNAWICACGHYEESLFHCS